jgi:hypothetical protein
LTDVDVGSADANGGQQRLPPGLLAQMQPQAAPPHIEMRNQTVRARSARRWGATKR